MYWIIDGLCFVAGITQFILAFTEHIQYTCWVGLIWIVIYPLLLEAICNLWTFLTYSPVVYSVKPQSHIVYSDHYNLSFCGLEKLHPFDAEKYGNIYGKLIEKRIISDITRVTVPDIPSRGLLTQKMSKIYLLKLCYTLGVCKYIQFPLVFLPGFLLRWRILNPMLRATQGSILSACVALKSKWSINLSGGFHHASFTTGGGFCIYPDISLIVHYLKTRMGLRRIMIIDLDAHQGNGYAHDLLQDPQIYIIDFYNHHIYPSDQLAKKAIKKDVKIYEYTTDKQYLRLVKEIDGDMDNFSPQFVIYNAGTDILEGDPLGGLRISAGGVIARDEEVVGMCVRRNVPVTMLLSGGYQKINAEIIADSIQNMMEKFN